MKNNSYLKNILLAVEIAIVCMAVVLIKAFAPHVVIPHIDIPAMVILSVIPMVISFYGKSEEEANCLYSVILAGLTFALLPMCAGWNTGMPVWKLLIAGGLVFGVTDVFCTSAAERTASGPKAPLALIMNGFLFYLASQCFQGII